MMTPEVSSPLVLSRQASSTSSSSSTHDSTPQHLNFSGQHLVSEHSDVDTVRNEYLVVLSHFGSIKVQKLQETECREKETHAHDKSAGPILSRVMSESVSMKFGKVGLSFSKSFSPKANKGNQAFSSWTSLRSVYAHPSVEASVKKRPKSSRSASCSDLYTANSTDLSVVQTVTRPTRASLSRIVAASYRRKPSFDPPEPPGPQAKRGAVAATQENAQQ